MSNDQPSAYDSLPPKRRLFVDHYIRTKNATESARLVKYSSPNSQGPRLLLNVGVLAAIKEREGKVEGNRLKKTQEYFLQLEAIAFNGEHGPVQVAALKELIRIRDTSSPKEKQKSEERQARIAYLKAKTSEISGGADELGDVLIKWEDAKE